MDKLEHQELQVPSCYQQQKLLLQMIVTMQANLVILTTSFIIEHLTSLKVIHQSAMLSIIVLIFLNFINYERDCHQMANKQLWMHPVPIITLVMGLLISLQIPGYSKMVSIVCFLSLIYNFVSLIRKNFQGWHDEMFFTIGQILLSFSLLSIEGVIIFDLKYLFFFPLLALLLILYGSNSFFFRCFSENRIIYSQIFMSKQRFIYLIVTTNTILSNLIVLLLWNFINHDTLLPFFKIMIGLNLFCVVILVIMFQQILLMTTMPCYQSDQTLFQISSRNFVNHFRSVNQKTSCFKQASCLLCQMPAVVIKMPCGHLTTCLSCNKKIGLKMFYSCIICKSLSNRINILLPIRKKGYKRRFFIEKKLQVNQYAVGYNQFQ